jgi:hypothetical protein
MSAPDELARALAARDVDVEALVLQAESEARAEVADTLRRLYVDDLLRRVTQRFTRADLVALVGIADGVTPLVLDVSTGDLDDERRLETQVREHNALLLHALEEGAVVPFRFGTTFADRAVLDEWVETHRVELALELDRLRGKAEWSVEILRRLEDPEPARYLEARLATAVRADVRTQLEEIADEHAGDAYLVAESRRAEFAAAVASLEEDGYALRVTGPWPPYSFARLP